MFNALFLTLVAYLLGSLPFGVWLGWLLIGHDIRQGGSGHTGGTNVVRQAGWGAGVVVAVLDVAKGFAAAWLARRYGHSQWAVVAAAGAVVAGHCWPILAGFRGGMGLSAAGGAMLAIYPLGFVIGLGLATAGTLALRHSARGNAAAGLLFGPAVGLVSGSATAGAAGLAVGILVALRAAADWRRAYRELWLDRERADPQSP